MGSGFYVQGVMMSRVAFSVRCPMILRTWFECVAGESRMVVDMMILKIFNLKIQ
jgi:hypothetical protein